MSKHENAPRRVRVERNIYRRPTGVYEVGFKDSGGRQRWRTVDGGITAARAVRDELLSRRARGERVASDARLRFGDAAARWLAGPVVALRPRHPGLLSQRSRTTPAAAIQHSPARCPLAR
jgi:hypothetical protein